MLIAAASLLVVSAAAAVPIEPQPRGVEADAPIIVRFDTHKMGIDHRTYEKVERYVTASSLFERATSHIWGLEGEVDLALHPKLGKADEAIAALKAMIPPDNGIYWTTVTDRR
ncbi:hypothetical protein GCM10008179_03470 [Hansschlegelia plantiphila]|uniref:Uncharacterized protein n=2 Tax=Hansschlegelia plantiphila TaxID=374655 RepID=A0A9W6IZJ1_9HYPH|nr:hypothetical protein GCM10008179_03470 [Hansschlegelia plantiphila]